MKLVKPDNVWISSNSYTNLYAPSLTYSIIIDHNSNAFDKFKSNVKPYHIKAFNESKTYTNEPLIGFKVTNMYDKPFVMDPRGFIVNISVANILELLNTSDIINGEFQEPMVHFIRGGYNILYNEKCEDFF